MKRFLPLLLLVALTGCKDKNSTPDAPPVPEISITTSDISVPETGSGTATITFTSSVPWTLETTDTKATPDWFDVSPKKGAAGSATLTVTITKANETYDDRNAYVKLNFGGQIKYVTVTQKKKGAILLTKDRADVGLDGGVVSAEVQSNMSYEIEIPSQYKTWITAGTKTKAMTTRQESFTIAEAPDSKPRSGMIIFFNGGIRDTLYVFQSHIDAIVLANKSVEVDEKAQRFEVDLKSNIEYTVAVQGGATWLRLEQTKLSRVDKIAFVVDENTVLEDRQAKVVFKDKNSTLSDTLTVNQFSRHAILLSNPVIHLSNASQEFKVKVRSNVAFTTSLGTNSGFIREKPGSKAFTETERTFTIDSNFDVFNSRKGTIIFTNEATKTSQTLTIVQAVATSDLMVSPNNIEIGPNDTTFVINVKAKVKWDITAQSSYILDRVSFKTTDSTISFQVTANQYFHEQIYTFKVTGPNDNLTRYINIKQYEKFGVESGRKRYEVDYKAQTMQIGLLYNVPYKLSIPAKATWITATTTKTMASAQHEFTLTENNTSEHRQARIEIQNPTDGKIIDTILVLQRRARIPYRAMAKADITQASTLYILSETSSGSMTKSPENKNTLLKIDKNGNIKRVKFYDAKGDSIATINPTFVRNLSDKFVYMQVTQTYDATDEGSNYIYETTKTDYYLVDKTDGGVYIVPENLSHSLYYNEIQTDYQQNIYFINNWSPSALYRMYTYGNSVDLKQITNNAQTPITFLTDQDGNTFFKYRVNNSWGFLCHRKDNYAAMTLGENQLSSYFVMKNTTAGIFKLYQTYESIYNPDTGWEHKGSTYLVKISPEPGEVKTETKVISTFQGTWGQIFYENESSNLIFTLNNKTILFPRGYEETSKTMAVCYDENNIKLLQIKDFPTKSLTKASITDNYIYNIKGSDILRMSIVTGNIETFYTNKEYQIYDLTVTNDDQIRFSALELRTNNDVVVEIKNSTAKVLSVDKDQRISSLVRIN